MRLVGEFSDIPTALGEPCACDRLHRLLNVREDQAARYRREMYRQERELASLRAALRAAGVDLPDPQMLTLDKDAA